MCCGEYRRHFERSEESRANLRSPAFAEDDDLFLSFPRKRLQPIRTFSEISIHLKIIPVKEKPVYQKTSRKVQQLRELGMTFTAIAIFLHVDTKTAIKAYEFGKP